MNNKDNKDNNGIYYGMIFLVLFLIGGLFEAAIITSEVLTSTGEKLFCSGMNVMIFLGIPVGVISLNKLAK